MSKHAITINLWVVIPFGLYMAAAVVTFHSIDTGSLLGSITGALGMAASYRAMVAGADGRPSATNTGGEYDV